MQIKRFEAKNMTTALRMVKKELGPEAVILSARSLRKGKGFFGSLKYAGVEISAAIDNQLSGMKNTHALSGKEPYRRFHNSRIQASRPTRRRDDPHNRNPRLQNRIPDQGTAYETNHTPATVPELCHPCINRYCCRK